MIIVNQNKESILNFDNTTTIRIDEQRENYEIVARVNNGYLATLGEYATKERAKEVLQEIIKTYIESKKVQEATSMFGFSIIPSNTYYEMPEE